MITSKDFIRHSFFYSIRYIVGQNENSDDDVNGFNIVNGLSIRRFF